MNILMLTPYLPYPLFSGGQIRTYNLLKNLSKKHNITLFALIKDDSERQFIPELEKYCSKVVVFKRSQRPFTLKNILRTGFSSFPFLVIRNLVDEVRGAVEEELKASQYDLIHAETFYMMPNIPRTTIPILLVEQTIEYLGYQSYADSSKYFFLKPFFAIDIYKIRWWEEYYWRTCSRLVTMSEEDKVYIQRSAPSVRNIEVVANGVDTNYFIQTKKTLAHEPTVLFVGTFKWLPNIEAVKILVKKIWPKIRADVPNARLFIAGSSPTREVYKMAQKDASIKVLGEVGDIRSAYAQAHILLAPVFSGKGTRYKVLEAMATQTPVVGTQLAVEGIRVKQGVHVLVGKTVEQLARQAVRLIRDRRLQKTLAKNGKDLVYKEYNWQKISEKLDSVYRSVGTARKRSTRS